MLSEEPFLKPASFLIEGFRNGNLDPLQFAELLLNRITDYDDKIKSFSILNPDLLKESGQAPKSSILSGLPFAVKDLIDTRNITTTYGSSYYSNNIPQKDAEIVKRLKAAGGTVQGKSNTHEFALGITTPPTRNPWDLGRIPGGSSGGSAAAVAAGLSVFALGTDTGGSIRIPSSLCGVTGLKPTYGSVNMSGVFPESFSEDHLGPICRYASDLEYFGSTIGYGTGSQDSGYSFKIGLVSDFFERSEKSVKNKVDVAVAKMESEGVIEEIDEIEIPDLELIKEMHEILDKSEIYYVHHLLYPKNTYVYPRDIVEEIEEGMNISASEYISSLRFKEKARSYFSDLIKSYDAIISPTLPKTAPTIEETRKWTLKDHSKFTDFLTPFNYLGVPAITVPCGFTDGLPVGLQIVSEFGRDDKVISLAARYQEITDWQRSIPNQYL